MGALATGIHSNLGEGEKNVMRHIHVAVIIVTRLTTINGGRASTDVLVLGISPK